MTAQQMAKLVLSHRIKTAQVTFFVAPFLLMSLLGRLRLMPLIENYLVCLIDVGLQLDLQLTSADLSMSMLHLQMLVVALAVSYAKVISNELVLGPL